MATNPPQPPETAAESDEQSSRVQLWRVVLAVLVLGGAVEVIIYGYLEKPGWIGSSGKQFWDYLELLIVPAALALGVYWLNRRQNERDQRAEDAQQERALAVESQRAQDEALQAYLDQMAQLLTDKELPLHEAQPGDSLSTVARARTLTTVARARTLTVLGRLDGGRKRSVLEFLYESHLIEQEHTLLNESNLIERRHNIVSLIKADLIEIDLYSANLSGADLRGTNLREADLRGATLSGADLRGTNLREANLTVTDLIDANLSSADLREADLRLASLRRADLRGTYLREANLSSADMSGANLNSAWLRGANLGSAWLSEANLNSANLSEANLSQANGVTHEQLSAARSLEGATMPDDQILKSDNNPDGPTFEEWLKSQDRKEDGENE